MTVGGKPDPTSPDGDAQLVARIAAREEAALREAIEVYATLLHRIAFRMTGDAAEAEDITQEAMLRLWDHAPKLRARGGAVKLGAWLKRVAMNLAFDRLRLRQRSSDAEIPEQEDDAPLADAMIEADEQTRAARDLVHALPDRQRAAIVLTYYEELPNAEAAAVLDMKIKAFESLLFRARAALRKAFDEREAAGGAA